MKLYLMRSIVLLVILSFLVPLASAFDNSMEEKEERPVKVGGMNSFISSQESVNLDGMLPQLEAYRQNTQRSRADGDLEFDLDATPMFTDLSDAHWQVLYADNQQNFDYFWGVKGELITYTPVINNAGTNTIDTFTLRLVATYAEASAEGWTLESGEEMINQTITLGPLAGGENTTTAGIDTSISWTPTCGCRIRLHLAIEYGSDPDDENNKLYYWPYILQEMNTLETPAEQNKWTLGNGWSVETIGGADPNPDHHSAPTVLESIAVGAQYAEYAMDFSNTVGGTAPLFGELDSPQETLAFVGLIFSGSGAASTWEFEFYNTTTQAWEGDLSGSQPINDGWYSYRYSDEAQTWEIYATMFLDEHLMGPGAKFRATGSNLWLDDFWVSSIENSGPFVPPEHQAPTLDFDVSLKEGEDDTQTLGPDNSTTFTYTIENTATTSKHYYWNDWLGANITSVDIINLDYPDDWTVTPDDLSSISLGPGETMDFEVAVVIPEEAIGSIYYEINPYKISFDATAHAQSPTPGGLPNADPATLTDEDIDTVEIVVSEVVNFAASCLVSEQAGARGAQLLYTLTIENTGNCNLTEDLTTSNDADVKVALGTITTEEGGMPKALWTTSAVLNTQSVEIDFEGSEDVTVTVNIPMNAYAGKFILPVEMEIPDYELVLEMELIVEVEQVYDLDLDVETNLPSPITVDPSKESQRTVMVAGAPPTFEISNKGNGMDTVIVEVVAETTGDETWITLEDGKGTIEVEADDSETFFVGVEVPEDAEHGYHNFTVKVSSEGTDAENEPIVLEEVISLKVERPDLEVSTKVAFLPSPVVVSHKNAGEDYLNEKATAIEVIIFNNGSADAGRFPVHLFVDGVLVGSEYVNSLAKGQYTSQPVVFEYAFYENKEYDIKVEVDPTGGSVDPLNGNVTEINEQNNEFSTTVTVVAPDLAFQNLDITDLVIRFNEGMEILEANLEDFQFIGLKDTSYTLELTVTNEGEADAENVMVKFEVLDSETFLPIATFWEEINSVKAFGTGIVTFQWMPELYGTEFWLTFTVDPDDNLTEADDNNNVWDVMADNGYTFVTKKKPASDSPGFGLMMAIVSMLGVCLVLYRRR